jgi:hypothetical protein
VGRLSNQGNYETAFIVFDARVGTSFEMRGEYEFLPPGKIGQFGIVLGYAEIGNTGEGWTTLLQSYAGGKPYATIMWGNYLSRVPQTPLHFRGSKVSVQLLCKGGLITCKMNDQEVYKDLQPMHGFYKAVPFGLKEDGKVGYRVTSNPSHITVRVNKMEVRRVP